MHSVMKKTLMVGLAVGLGIAASHPAWATDPANVGEVLSASETDMTSVKTWILTYGAPLIIAISVLFFGLRKAGKLFGR